jgi:diguanylate cyclase (GGDEF)-like protein
MLFLVTKDEEWLEGKMGIGPDSEEEATTIWSHIEKHRMGFDELIETHGNLEHLVRSKLNSTIKSIRIPVKEESGIIALSVMEGMPFVIDTEEKRRKIKNEFSQQLDLREYVTVPLKARDKVIGVILADNRFTKKPITNNDIRMLTMFANQAGLAIQNSRLYEQTVILSNSDSLTGLWHHGYFQYLLDEEIKSSGAKKEPFTLLMIDIDDFKKFNDSYGHQAGDSILITISDLFREVSRKIDITARYGGEEFAAILRSTKKQDAIVLAERLRKSVEENKNLHGLTISIGLASFPEDAKEKETLISKADKALYQAKKDGKNKISF